MIKLLKKINKKVIFEKKKSDNTLSINKINIGNTRRTLIVKKAQKF